MGEVWYNNIWFFVFDFGLAEMVDVSYYGSAFFGNFGDSAVALIYPRNY